MWCFILWAPGVKRGNCGVPLKNAVLSDEAHTNIRTHTHTQTHVGLLIIRHHSRECLEQDVNSGYNADAFICTFTISAGLKQ